MQPFFFLTFRWILMIVSPLRRCPAAFSDKQCSSYLEVVEKEKKKTGKKNTVKIQIEPTWRYPEWGNSSNDICTRNRSDCRLFRLPGIIVSASGPDVPPGPFHIFETAIQNGPFSAGHKRFLAYTVSKEGRPKSGVMSPFFLSAFSRNSPRFRRSWNWSTIFDVCWV